MWLVRLRNRICNLIYLINLNLSFNYMCLVSTHLTEIVLQSSSVKTINLVETILLLQHIGYMASHLHSYSYRFLSV